MNSGLRHAYLVSVIEALAAHAAEDGEVHFATINDGGKIAITFTIEDGAAYNERVTALFNERFVALNAAGASTDGVSP